MDEIAREFADRAVASVFVYTREAHPAENCGHHIDFDLKLRHARALRDQLGVSRPILVDDLEGSCHRAWGMLPNMAWIVFKGGTIGYKADWTDPMDVAGALEELLEDDGTGKTPFYNERLRHRVNDREAFMRGLQRNGPKAIQDFSR
jgi:hypothetical protein